VLHRPLLLLAAAATFALPARAGAAAAFDLRVYGTEIPPISSSLGTFVGAAQGPVGAWRIQIRHQPLRTGPTVAITGGSLWLGLRTGTALQSSVVGGSVTVSDRGAGCTDQVYAVRVTLQDGSFSGTLTHRRRSLLGHCLIYAATISGRASIAA
jgi:hypothetical protein